VRGAGEALRAGAALEPETRERLLDVISRAAEQLARLADDLLATARLDTDRLDLVLAPCDAAAVAREVAEAARASSPGRSINVDSPDGLPPAAADAGRLRQVLANLVENALVHGGGAIELTVEKAEGRVRIAVTDAGPGIPGDQRERIFEPFARFAAPEVPGSGLGLHLARELVDGMGGDLSVADAPGGGTTFTVSLRPA
jgi:signal transduction histidine kinase